MFYYETLGTKFENWYAMIWFGCQAAALSIGSGVFYALSNEGPYDVYQFIIHMIVWPQNFVLWIVLLLE